MFAEAIEIPEDAELSDAALGYWDAWHLLTNDRPLGAFGGAGGIPWSSVERYAKDNLFDPSQLARMIAAMDAVYLAWLAEQQKKT